MRIAGSRMSSATAVIMVIAALSIPTGMVSYGSHVTAEAGPDQTVVEGSTVQLAGLVTGSNPSDMLTYVWVQENAPLVTLSDGTATNPTFVAPQVDATTTIWLILQVIADGSMVASDAVAITISNNPNAPGPAEPRATPLSSNRPFLVPSADNTNPKIVSVERVGNATRAMGEPLAFNVTFSEDVTGVDSDDFTLVVDGNTTTIIRTNSSFAKVTFPNQTIPGGDTSEFVIEVNPRMPGMHDGSPLPLSVANGTAMFDIAGISYALEVLLTAPDHRTITLHNQTFAWRYELAEPRSILQLAGGPVIGNWTLSVTNHAKYSPATVLLYGLALEADPPVTVNGTGANWLVTVKTTQPGHHQLALVDGHEIRDNSGNLLVDANPTRTNHDYLVRQNP